jgi:hypothetical protein
MIIHKKLAAAAGALTLAGGLAMIGAGPALASTCSAGSTSGAACVTVTVPSTTETITLTTGTLSLGSVPAGTSDEDNPVAEEWSVTGNDSKGFEVYITPSATELVGSSSASDTIANSNVSFVNVVTAALTTFSGDSPVSAGTSTTDSGTGEDGWFIDVPSGQAPDTYSETFTYSVVGN